LGEVAEGLGVGAVCRDDQFFEFVEDVAGLLDGVEDAVVLGNRLEDVRFVEDTIESYGFEAAKAEHFPAGVDHLIDQEMLGRRIGFVLFSDLGDQLVEVLLGFGGEDGDNAAGQGVSDDMRCWL
jgi:hypothetical protein